MFLGFGVLVVLRIFRILREIGLVSIVFWVFSFLALGFLLAGVTLGSRFWFWVDFRCLRVCFALCDLGFVAFGFCLFVLRFV